MHTDDDDDDDDDDGCASRAAKLFERKVALVQWLWEMTHFREGVGSNPCVRNLNGHDILFTLSCCKI